MMRWNNALEWKLSLLLYYEVVPMSFVGLPILVPIAGS